MSSITKAANATDQIQDHVSVAIDRLQHGFNGRIVNGYGIYSDPSMRRSDLVEAQKAIEAALSVMRSTDWPSNAEYDALDQGSEESVNSP
ncbi:MULTISPECIES: hypothetical protein [Hyphomicrobiales]|uniref:hypothetical protein n=1 Tax=Hyphomicrobiales TaxID=356 RepID=UPI0003743590|nr:hypothetical protein [Hoeflea sp. 108]